MTERPALFAAPMVRAILRDVDPKTQTRRVVKPQPTFRDDHLATDLRAALASCRYGAPGDRIWVRESGSIAIDKTAWLYADGGCKIGPTAPPGSENWCREWKSAPSIHMPRWASRITLEVTGVRVERLQDISEADAIAEGIGERKVSENESRWIRYDRDQAEGLAYSTTGNPRVSYRSLWESVNGPGSWARNPWVWAISFRRLPAGAA